MAYFKEIYERPFFVSLLGSKIQNSLRNSGKTSILDNQNPVKPGEYAGHSPWQLSYAFSADQRPWSAISGQALR